MKELTCLLNQFKRTSVASDKAGTREKNLREYAETKDQGGATPRSQRKRNQELNG